MSGRDLPRHRPPVLHLPPQLTVDIEEDLSILEIAAPLRVTVSVALLIFEVGFLGGVVGTVPRALEGFDAENVIIHVGRDVSGQDMVLTGDMKRSGC